MKFNLFTKAALLISATLTLSSCDIGDDSGNYYLPNPNVAYGYIINASPSSGSLNFFADENRINNQGSLNYGNAAGYYNFITGNRTLTLRNNIGEILASADVTLNQGDYFSVFAVNTFNNIELTVYNDSLPQPGLNTAQIRFINLSPDAGAITIEGVSETYAENLDFKDATGFTSIPNGTYEFTFTDSETGEELLTTTASVLAGRAYTIFTKGFVSPPEDSNETFTTQEIRHY